MPAVPTRTGPDGRGQRSTASPPHSKASMQPVQTNTWNLRFSSSFPSSLPAPSPRPRRCCAASCHSVFSPCPISEAQALLRCFLSFCLLSLPRLRGPGAAALLPVILSSLPAPSPRPRRCCAASCHSVFPPCPIPEAQALLRPEVERLFLESYMECLARRQESTEIAESLRYAAPWGFQLRDVAAPTKVWAGVQDVGSVPAMARRLAAEMPNCELEVLEGRGHLAWAEGDVLEEVERWLGLPGRGSGGGGAGDGGDGAAGDGAGGGGSGPGGSGDGPGGGDSGGGFGGSSGGNGSPCDGQGVRVASGGGGGCDGSSNRDAGVGPVLAEQPRQHHTGGLEECDS
eukprot:366577-Chlamydomonas_euryale.AAC.24